jgi:glucose-1-phosphate adenylyltransferase
MALISETPALDMYDPEWVIHTRSEERPPVLLGNDAHVDGSLLSDGCRVEGRVIRSVLSPGVYVAPGAVVRDSVLFTDAVIEPGAVIDRAIIDKYVKVGEGATIGDGEDNVPNREHPTALNTGLTIIGKGSQIPSGAAIGRNCTVRPHVRVRDKKIESGSSV